MPRRAAIPRVRILHGPSLNGSWIPGCRGRRRLGRETSARRPRAPRGRIRGRQGDEEQLDTGPGPAVDVQDRAAAGMRGGAGALAERVPLDDPSPQAPRPATGTSRPASGTSPRSRASRATPPARRRRPASGLRHGSRRARAWRAPGLPLRSRYGQPAEGGRRRRQLPARTVRRRPVRGRAPEPRVLERPPRGRSRRRAGGDAERLRAAGRGPLAAVPGAPPKTPGGSSSRAYRPRRKTVENFSGGKRGRGLYCEVTGVVYDEEENERPREATFSWEADPRESPEFDVLQDRFNSMEVDSPSWPRSWDTSSRVPTKRPTPLNRGVGFCLPKSPTGPRRCLRSSSPGVPDLGGGKIVPHEVQRPSSSNGRSHGQADQARRSRCTRRNEEGRLHPAVRRRARRWMLAGPHFSAASSTTWSSTRATRPCWPPSAAVTSGPRSTAPPTSAGPGRRPSGRRLPKVPEGQKGRVPPRSG